jgi:hypothetical protein
MRSPQRRSRGSAFWRQKFPRPCARACAINDLAIGLARLKMDVIVGTNPASVLGARRAEDVRGRMAGLPAGAE